MNDIEKLGVGFYSIPDDCVAMIKTQRDKQLFDELRAYGTVPKPVMKKWYVGVDLGDSGSDYEVMAKYDTVEKKIVEFCR